MGGYIEPAGQNDSVREGTRVAFHVSLVGLKVQLFKQKLGIFTACLTHELSLVNRFYADIEHSHGFIVPFILIELFGLFDLLEGIDLMELAIEYDLGTFSHDFSELYLVEEEHSPLD